MIIDVHGHTGYFFYHSRFNDSKIKNYVDKYNIKKMVLSSSRAIKYDINSGNSENYKYIMKYKWAYGYVVVNPNDIKGSELELEKYLGKEKIVGLKFHPVYSKYPIDGENTIKLFKIADSYGLCSLIHADCDDLAKPSRLLKLAKECPNTKFILAHMGNLCWQEAFKVVLKTDNIFMDIVSSWMEFDRIRDACNIVGVDKIMFGSDIGLFDPAIFIGFVLSSNISDKDRNKIFYENALRIFKF